MVTGDLGGRFPPSQGWLHRQWLGRCFDWVALSQANHEIERDFADVAQSSSESVESAQENKISIAPWRIKSCMHICLYIYIAIFVSVAKCSW